MSPQRLRNRSCHHSASRCWNAPSGNRWRAACSCGMASQPKCSTVTRVPVATGSKRDGHLGRLVLGELGLPPLEDQPVRWVPLPHAADLEPLAVGADLDETLGGLGLERQATAVAIGEPEQPVRLPPLADLAGERGEGPRRRRGDADRHEHPRAAHAALDVVLERRQLLRPPRLGVGQPRLARRPWTRPAASRCARARRTAGAPPRPGRRVRSTRRCRLITGGETPSASASSPARGAGVRRGARPIGGAPDRRARRA